MQCLYQYANSNTVGLTFFISTNRLSLEKVITKLPKKAQYPKSLICFLIPFL